jgi:predicted nucleic-acid-binding Zn-ribbon protein
VSVVSTLSDSVLVIFIVQAFTYIFVVCQACWYTLEHSDHVE